MTLQTKSPTTRVLLELYSSIDQPAEDMQKYLDHSHNSHFGGDWIRACLNAHSETPRSSGLWRRIAYCDFLTAMQLLDVQSVDMLNAMKPFLVGKSQLGEEVALMLELASDLLNAPEERPKEDWELGEVYAETFLRAEGTHQPQAWLTQAYQEFKRVLRALRISPDDVKSALAATSHGDSKWDDRRPEGK